jgi:hypothetical protein
MSRSLRLFAPLALAGAFVLSAALTPGEQASLDRISAAALKGHVSFLASDALEGRDTPSKGLDVAAEYIAAQFRKIGLEAVGDDGYFQTAPYITVTPKSDGFEMTLITGGQTISVPKDKVRINAAAALEIADAEVLKVVLDDAATVEAMTAEQVKGKVLFLTMPNFMTMSEEERGQAFSKVMRARAHLVKIQPALALMAGRGMMTGGARPMLREAGPKGENEPPQINVTDDAFIKFFQDARPGPVDAKISVKLPQPEVKPVKLRNVVGLLRGSDPALKDTCLLVTAHYDHDGINPRGQGDTVMNGANDDASGAASMIEIAAALAASPQRPKRSILFMAYFGEERGLLGSRYYARNPIFPLAKTVGNINLEHMGRTDDNEGPQLKRGSFTGFDYSTLPEFLKQAGAEIGVEFYKHEKNSDSYFGRSDNQALADAGVPAHTLCVAFMFPDYHRPGDHWDKIDYDNMALVTRAVALGVWRLAGSAEAVKWNEANAKAARYVKAAAALQGAH